MRGFLGCCFALLVLVGGLPPAAADDGWVGAELSSYLDALNERGFRIIYSSDLVGRDMRLESGPVEPMTQPQLSALLGRFGLALKDGPDGSLLVIRAAAAAASVDAPQPVSDDVPIPEIVVTSSLHRLEYLRPTTHTYFDRELATRIPAAAEEAVRLTNRLPGTASGGISARNHVRGGERNETLFLLDGLRLYEPYHLKDFQSVATIVNSNSIDGLDFYSGAFPARYGDRMSAVMSISLREPSKPLETELSLSFFNTSALSLGTFGDDERGEWLFAARRGNLDLVFDVINSDVGSPAYQDYLARVSWEFGPRATISTNLLASSDKIALNEPDRGERAGAGYDNQVLWIGWLAEWSSRLSSETTLAATDVRNKRDGVVELPGIVNGSLVEDRDFQVLELNQAWQYTLSPALLLAFGANLKELEATYRLSSTRAVEPPFDTLFDNLPLTTRDADITTEGAQYTVFAEMRWRFAEKLLFELGLRWDQQNYTTADDDRQYSPRASILYRLAPATDVRFGWGQYYQAQEINELQVSDGIVDFFPAQRAEHFVLNVKHVFGDGIDVDLSVYRKSFRTIRPRFENVFNSLTLLPELQFDRVRVDADGAEALGAELTLTRGTASENLLWWLGYAWSRAEDRTDAGKVPRSWDQTHTLKGGLSWRWGPWDFSAAAEAHTGWPRSTLSGETVTDTSGNDVLALTASGRNVLRYPAFHTLDIRVSRDFDPGPGELTAWLEVTNLYDRANPCCAEYSIDPVASGAGRLVVSESHWLPLVPSLGVLWRF